MKLSYIAVFFLALMPMPSLATSVNNVGIRAQSFGGAIRAQASSNDVIFYNPAGILKNRRISSDFDYFLDSNTRDHRFGASLVDSSTGTWALGLAYSGLLRPEKKSSHLAYVSLAMPIITDALVIGASGNYSYDGELGPSPFAHFFNLDLGFLANLPHGISFALSADHILSPKGNEKSLGLAMGAAFDLGAIVETIPLSFSFDWLMDNVRSEEDQDHIIGTGMQYIILNLLPVRVGFKSMIEQKKKLLSLGAGVITSSFSIDGLYQQDLSLGKNRYFGAALRFTL